MILYRGYHVTRIKIYILDTKSEKELGFASEVNWLIAAGQETDWIVSAI